VLVLVAPGQGAQTPGFLTPWLDLPGVEDRLRALSTAIDLDLVHYGTNADADEIRDTAIAQPLLVAAGLVSAAALGDITPGAVAGHSVGEITAAVFAGVLDDTAALGLVRRRGLAMADAAAITETGMSALLDRSCLTATGPDASALLQSLLSNDVDQAAPGAGVYALLLTPKARVISDVELFNTGDGYVLACPSDRAGIVEQTILRARFRRKVELAPSGHAVVWGDAPDPLATLETPAGPHRLLAAAPVATNPLET